MPENAKHARLRELLNDRNSKEPKGRASIEFPIILDAALSLEVSLAQQHLAAVNGAIETHQREQAQAKEDGKGDRRVGSKTTIPADLKNQLDAAQVRADAADEAADDAMVQLVLVALKSEQYDELIKAHPPREDNADDAKNGVNVHTFPDALLRACATKVLDDEDAEIEMDLTGLIDGMSSGERQVARQAAQQINVQVATVPFYNANSQSRRRNGAK